MKSPSYVYTVTKIYRKLLDERRGPKKEEKELLLSAFSRGGFTDGYFVAKTERGMTGVRSEADKKRFLELYFSREKGIGYNFGRSHINSCDFSLDIYSNVEEGDMTLDTFNLNREKKYIIPFIKDALAYCDQEIVLFASPWSPPAYMKDNGSVVKGGSLLEECKALWANYYVKYIKEMAKEGINFSAISVQNEPKAKQTWESCFYSPEDEAYFIDKYLISALDDAGLSHIKIMI